MSSKLTPEELLTKAIAENNIELVKEAHVLLQQQKLKVVKKSKKTKKIGKIDKKSKTTIKKNKIKKPTTFKNDAEYILYLQQLEHEHYNNIINQKAGRIAEDTIHVDIPKTVLKTEEKLDKLMGKTKRQIPTKRPKIQYIDKICPKCGRTIQININEVGMYNWDINKINSEKPLFTCGC